MTATLETYGPKIREAEEMYYAKLNGNGVDDIGSPVVREAIDLRNKGIDTLKAGHPEDAVDALSESVRLLGAYNTTGTKISPFVQGFDRELYASLAAKAQALCAAGEFSSALGHVWFAKQFTPKPLLFDQKDGDDLPDQYEITFSGRLAVIMCTNKYRFYRGYVAVPMFRRARAIAPISQDPRAVVFTNNELTPKERKESARKATWFARFGSVVARTPSSKLRDLVAEIMCTK
jgi:hypothetical protein